MQRGGVSLRREWVADNICRQRQVPREKKHSSQRVHYFMSLRFSFRRRELHWHFIDEPFHLFHYFLRRVTNIDGLSMQVRKTLSQVETFHIIISRYLRKHYVRNIFSSVSFIIILATWERLSFSRCSEIERSRQTTFTTSSLQRKSVSQHISSRAAGTFDAERLLHHFLHHYRFIWLSISHFLQRETWPRRWKRGISRERKYYFLYHERGEILMREAERRERWKTF